ncbi:hypothetical protein QVD17_20263 [Tagetes erecta]|uniref:Zinc finger PHD-type domain-containing protein n=1 Tax=Tagetes erecta TaxID=13708 RepID=A0AAD8NXQ9_TARER|nr:hypothetical protein QVD17_20263 [Tagetes erecta]
MDQGYKHFSHLHNLVMHQMPEGVEVSCSCCHSSATGTVYVCWQCNFFVHEQCFKASRSLKHPSHPPHPLTLVPYPTYPSSSFYCNSCQIMGTGFSYSCADCEFDLHVQCAYSISGPTSWNGVQNSNMANNVPFVSVHDQSHSVPFTHPPNMPYTPPDSVPNAHYHSTVHQNSIPTSQNPTMAHNMAYVQHPSMAQNGPSVSIPTSFQHPTATVQYPPMAHTGPSGGQDPSVLHNGPKNEAIKHFTHPHSLSIVDLKSDNENEVICSGCKGGVIGKGYSCSEPNCNFHLHESCFNLKKEIHHKSHPEHLLNLLPFAPYTNKNGEFTCNACFNTGRGFTYHCSICNFDLHITCASLSETVKRPDHEHVLKLFYSCPVQGEEHTVSCDVCYEQVQKERWAYYCESCDFGTHLGCVDYEKHERKESSSVIDTQVQLQRLQLQMQMNQQLAQMMASMGASISNLVLPITVVFANLICTSNVIRNTFSCDVCHGDVQKDCWAYYCESCDYGTHLGCVDCEECEMGKNLDMQVQLQRLRLQAHSAQLQAQLMGRIGWNLIG